MHARYGLSGWSSDPPVCATAFCGANYDCYNAGRHGRIAITHHAAGRCFDAGRDGAALRTVLLLSRWQPGLAAPAPTRWLSLLVRCQRCRYFGGPAGPRRCCCVPLLCGVRAAAEVQAGWSSVLRAWALGTLRCTGSSWLVVGGGRPSLPCLCNAGRILSLEMLLRTGAVERCCCWISSSVCVVTCEGHQMPGMHALCEGMCS